MFSFTLDQLITFAVLSSSESGDFVLLRHRDMAYRVPFDLHFLLWSSVCLVGNVAQCDISFIQDGHLNTFENSACSFSKDHGLIRSDGILIFGQEQDEYGGLFDPDQSYKGQLADFHLFDEIITDKEVLINWTSEANVTLPITSIINFTDFENYTAVNVSIKTLEEISFNPNSSVRYAFFTQKMGFNKAAGLCRSLGGNLIVPRDELENNQLFDVFSKSTFCQKESTMWLGATLNRQNQVIHHSTEERSPYNNSVALNTNVMYKPCLIFYGCKTNRVMWWRKWIWSTCQLPQIVGCSLTGTQTFRIRGLPRGSEIDSEYFLDHKLINPRMIGKYRSILDVAIMKHNAFYVIFDVANIFHHQIVLRLMDIPYPFGRYVWNDRDGVEPIKLMLTSCKPDEYTCRDATCIPRKYMCDNKKNCPDWSDERNCNVLMKGRKADLNHPPVPETGKLKLRIKVDVLRVIKLDLSTFSMLSDISMTVMWYDSTLSFKNLNERTEINSIRDLRAVWHPEYEILGYNMSLSSVQDRTFTMVVIKKTDQLPDDIQSQKEGKEVLQHE